MRINPFLRLTFLGAILVIGFFSIILLINSLSSQNKVYNDQLTEIYKQQMQSVNYRNEIERKIDNDVRLNEGLGAMERVNINTTVKANSSGQDPNKVDQSKTAPNKAPVALVGY
jgi:DNA-binding protein H-NS